MSLNITRARQLLANGDLRLLFVEELGWDRHNARLDVLVGPGSFTLSALAQKRGMVAWHCQTPGGQGLSDYALRRRIEHQVSKSAHEHLIVFTDASQETQTWQWVKREPGKPAACREHTYHRSQPGDALLQKLEAIAFSLDEEATLSLVDVTRRARAGFDIERVTKRFYERFQNEHAAFLSFISGITETADREWYASVMLNRMMFVYFIQRKGFLDGDPDYLRNRLNRMRAEHGKDKFYSFYRYFLLRLFHEGLGGRERPPQLETLLGRIPYLNGGLFDVHELERPERYGMDIQIPDDAFERIFTYFDQYQWHLDERPLRADNEINPDVLGYIFEKYVNQKQMGAYYTREDITEYIGKNTVIPYLIDAARAKCKVAFENPGGPTVWDLLRDNPDRYIYSAVRHGMTWDVHSNGPLQHRLELPEDIARGLQPPTTYQPRRNRAVLTLELRREWNRSAPAGYALPTETWREVIARRTRYEELKAKLAAGEVRNVNELIELNLDVHQFAQDVIENCEGPALLRALWHAIETVTILDPTCGSGAFLFAALNILEPLYEACLDRLEAFVADLDRLGQKRRPDQFADFCAVLARVAAHPNRRYFIFKSIILNNLYGVDIMEEAVEICKLRFFLKLAAQVDPDPRHPNLGIEPLPDIDFNIRAGNALVGYVTYDEVERAVSGQLDFDKAMDRISRKAADLQEAFDGFRSRQIEGEAFVSPRDKQELEGRLEALGDELDRYLVSQYATEPKTETYSTWLNAHRPFHWFVEFYGILASGGFDVIIGNPPYVEVPRDLNRALLRQTFVTALEKWSRDEDLYTMVVERSLRLLSPVSAQFGMILPLSLAFSTKKPFAALRRLIAVEKGLWLWSHFDRIPSALFGNEVRTRCTVAILSRRAEAEQAEAATTSLLRWNAQYRDHLFSVLRFAELRVDIAAGIPKVASQLQADVLKQLLRANAPLAMDLRRPISFNFLLAVAPAFPTFCVYVGGTAYNWFPAWRDIPETTTLAGEPSLPARTAGFRFSDAQTANIIFALLCSSVGYWWWAVASDGFNLKKWLLDRFPLSTAMIPVEVRAPLAALGENLRKELKRHYVYKDNKGRIGNFLLPACEREVAEIDAFLGDKLPALSPSFFEDIRHFNACFSRGDGSVEEVEDDE